MRNMIEARNHTNDSKRSLLSCAQLWNEAVIKDGHPEFELHTIPSRRKALVSRMDTMLEALTPDIEIIAATLVTEGDVIYNAATGEQYQVGKVTISDHNTAILANRGPQVFFAHDELVTVVKRDRRVHTRDDMQMVSIPAGEVIVGSYVYVCGFFRLVTKIEVLTNNIRYSGEGFSVILGKGVKVDAGATLTDADCVCEGQRILVGTGQVATVQKTRRESSNIVEIMTGGKWRQAYNHTRLSVL